MPLKTVLRAGMTAAALYVLTAIGVMTALWFPPINDATGTAFVRVNQTRDRALSASFIVATFFLLAFGVSFYRIGELLLKAAVKASG